MKSTTLFAAAALAASQLFGTALAADKTVRDTKPTQKPSAVPIPGASTPHGCYSSGGNLTKNDVPNLSSGVCIDNCEKKKYYVAGLHGEDCLCGNAYPPKDDETNDDDCSYPCPNYPLEACGGLGSPGYYSIFNTGVQVDVPDYVEEESSSSSSAVETKTATQTAVATSSAAAETTSAAADEGSSSNTPAIAGGVVGGVVVVAGVFGGLFFFMRRRRNAEIEEEHRRNAAVNAFISGAKPPGSSDGISMSDSRLDPVMAHHRLSDGSIADNQDYSRRILRVTNA